MGQNLRVLSRRKTHRTCRAGDFSVGVRIFQFPTLSVHGFPISYDRADRSCWCVVLPRQAWHGYMATSAHRVEVQVDADGHASAPLSGAAAASPPAGVQVIAYASGIFNAITTNKGRWWYLRFIVCDVMRCIVVYEIMSCTKVTFYVTNCTHIWYMIGARRRRSGGGPRRGCARGPVGIPSPPRGGR
jgi:hypothetical protein